MRKLLPSQNRKQEDKRNGIPTDGQRTSAPSVSASIPKMCRWWTPVCRRPPIWTRSATFCCPCRWPKWTAAGRPRSHRPPFACGHNTVLMQCRRADHRTRIRTFGLDVFFVNNGLASCNAPASELLSKTNAWLCASLVGDDGAISPADLCRWLPLVLPMAAETFPWFRGAGKKGRRWRRRDNSDRWRRRSGSGTRTGVNRSPPSRPMGIRTVRFGHPVSHGSRRQCCSAWCGK